jgi:Bacterial nucleoid DNA-binding protein
VTKKDIVIRIAEDTEYKQIEVKEIVQKALDHIIEALTKGDTVELRNFGIFKVKSRKSRVGRNPKTGETVPIPEKRIVSFKPGMVMKKKVMK